MVQTGGVPWHHWQPLHCSHGEFHYIEQRRILLSAFRDLDKSRRQLLSWNSIKVVFFPRVENKFYSVQNRSFNVVIIKKEEDTVQQIWQTSVCERSRTLTGVVLLWESGFCGYYNAQNIMISVMQHDMSRCSFTKTESKYSWSFCLKTAAQIHNKMISKSSVLRH